MRFSIVLFALVACASAVTWNVGYFSATGLMAVSTQEQFYKSAGIDVNFILVPGSIAAFDWLASGYIDGLLTAVDNSINRYYNRLLNTTLLSGGDLGPDYIMVGTNGVKTFADIKGKSVIVDSVSSGFTALIQRILLNNGLTRDVDYTFIGVGGTPLRYQALLDGQYNGTKVYAALLTFPYPSLLSAANRSDIYVLGRASDYVAPYQSVGYAILTSKLKNATAMEYNTRFLEGYYLAYLFANNSANREKVITDLSSNAFFNLSRPVATNAYGAILNQVSGEVVNNLFLSPLGIINVVAIRQQFGGFSYPANFSAAQLENKDGGVIIDYTALREAQRRALAVANAPSYPCKVTIVQTFNDGIFLDSYTVTIKNNGNTAANPIIQSSFIDGLTYFNFVPQLVYRSTANNVNNYNLRAGALAPGASTSFTYIARNMQPLTVSQAAAC